MNQGSLELVFYGKYDAGHALEEVKSRVAQLFKAPPEKIEVMFSGKRVVIKNGLDENAARKYIHAMKSCGAICQIELMGAPGHVYDLPEPQPEASPSPSTLETVAHPSQATPQATGERLQVAGERTDAVLANVHVDIAPPGSRLSDDLEQESLIDSFDRGWTLAPTGSDLQDQKEEVPPIVPDTSHIRLDE